MNSPRTLLAATAACVVLAGCDIPTEPPLIDQRWIIPVDETTLSVDELLPTSVTTVGGDFDIAVDPVSASETLGNLCGAACLLLNGLTAPVPAFQGSFSSSRSLPADVASAEVTGGSIDVTITNGFSFDPLANGGALVLTLTDDATGAALGTLSLDGATDALPAGGTTVYTVPLSPGTVTGALRATVDVDVPGGQTAQIDAADQVQVTAAVNELLVGSVTIDVTGTSVSFEDQQLDLEDVDSDIADRILGGTLVLEIENPFAVGVDGTIDIGTTSKSFSLAGAGSSTVTLTYTGDELRSFIGQPDVTFSGSGVANGTSLTIQPGQQMLIDATLDFTLRIG